MVYVFGFIGFVLGFAAGLFIINMFLKGYRGRDLLNNRSLKYTYGLAVWIIAALGAWGGVWFYNRTFI
jgi:hypothetical protein